MESKKYPSKLTDRLSQNLFLVTTNKLMFLTTGGGGGGGHVCNI